jgi:hypothetical protein
MLHGLASFQATEAQLQMVEASLSAAEAAALATEKEAFDRTARITALQACHRPTRKL